MKTSHTATIDTGHAAVRVLVPGMLWSYTAGAKHVDLAIASHSQQPEPVLADVLAELDSRFPGLRFRIIDERGKIRPHIKIFVDGELARDLAVSLPPSSEVMIVGALSGG